MIDHIFCKKTFWGLFRTAQVSILHFILLRDFCWYVPLCFTSAPPCAQTVNSTCPLSHRLQAFHPKAAYRQEVEYSRSFPGLKTSLGKETGCFAQGKGVHDATMPSCSEDVQYWGGARWSCEPTGQSNNWNANFHQRRDAHWFHRHRFGRKNMKKTARHASQCCQYLSFILHVIMASLGNWVSLKCYWISWSHLFGAAPGPALEPHWPPCSAWFHLCATETKPWRDRHHCRQALEPFLFLMTRFLG